MKTINYYVITLMTIVAVLFTACKENGPQDEDSKIKNGSQEAVDAACNQWKQSRQYWEWSEAFLFGPATTYGIDPHTDTWPFAKAQFENLMKKYNPASDEDDAAFIDEYIATGQSSAGFHAVEYIIFRDGQPRSISDFTEDEVYYAVAASNDLYIAAIKLVAAWGGEISKDEEKILEDAEWEPENNFGEEHFLNQSGTNAAVQIIEGCHDIIGEVSEAKIGSAYTGEDTDYIESPYAHNSIQDFKDNVLSCQHALFGGLDATQPLEGSLIAYTDAVPAMQEQSAKVKTALANAIAKIEAMKKPFVLNYSDISSKNAMDALNELDEELDELEDLLKAYANNETQNTQLKITAEKYYQNVVLATYRGLADQGKRLAERVEKISQ